MIEPFSLWDNPITLLRAEQARMAKSGERTVPYACYHAKFNKDRVYCELKHQFPTKHGTLPLLAVLRGRNAKMCQICKDKSV